MTAAGTRLAAAALAMVGAPFRLGGRDPVTGVDCIGLVAAALEAGGYKVPPLPGYSLRQHSIGRFLELAESLGLGAIEGPPGEGDILLLHPSPAQCHLAIGLADGGIVHAHAELRRVVITPPPMPWRASRCWRLA